MSKAMRNFLEALAAFERVTGLAEDQDDDTDNDQVAEDNPWHKSSDGKFGGPGDGSWSLTCRRSGQYCKNNAPQGGKFPGKGTKKEIAAANADPRKKLNQQDKIQQKDCGSHARTAGGNIRCADGVEIEPLGKATQFKKGQKKPANKG